MSTPWTSRSGAERQRLARRFADLGFAEEMLEGDDSLAEATPAVPFQRLYAAAVGEEPLGAELAAALLADPDLRADFDLLLERTAHCRVPAAAVASTGELDRREADGVSISLVPSHANQAQVYVLIEVEERLAKGCRCLVVRTRDGTYVNAPLPQPDAGVVRLLKNAEDPLASALRDPGSEVFVL